MIASTYLGVFDDALLKAGLNGTKVHRILYQIEIVGAAIIDGVYRPCKNRIAACAHNTT